MKLYIVGCIMFAFGYFVAALMAAARRGEDREWEWRYAKLVEVTAKRIDQAKGD